MHDRTPLARAEFFLTLAERCSIEERIEFEAFLEASIVFARAALHRLKKNFESHPLWPTWFSSLKGDRSVEFFREQRDFLLKEAPPKLGQIISFDPAISAAKFYYFDDPTITAAATIRSHLQRYAEILKDGEDRFQN